MSSDKETKPTKIHLHAGHRERLRSRFIKTGADSLQDYEMLEMLLFYAIPRRDVKVIAKEMLRSFGSVQRVMAADISDLIKIKGITENSAVLIKAVYSVSQLMLKEEVQGRSIINSWDKLMDYCHVSMAYEKKEQFRVLYLNKKNELIADEVQQVGTVDHTPVYPREIVKGALDKGATAIILVHNHPSGDSMPSNSDIDMTRDIIKAASSMNIVVHDHIIISKGDATSFKALGLLG